MKELPKMYRNKIEKELTNNEKMYCSMYQNVNNKNVNQENKLSITKNKYTVEQKIANIFNSPSYIYKIDVVIVTDTTKANKRIVGKTKTNLITIEQEYIPINSIRDIYIVK